VHSDAEVSAGSAAQLLAATRHLRNPNRDAKHPVITGSRCRNRHEDQPHGGVMLEVIRELRLEVQVIHLKRRSSDLPARRLSI
jgi:hypothetical protein